MRAVIAMIAIATALIGLTLAARSADDGMFVGGMLFFCSGAGALIPDCGRFDTGGRLPGCGSCTMSKSRRYPPGIKPAR